MQNELNRLLLERHKFLADLENRPLLDLSQMVENEWILDPDAPVTRIVERVAREASSDPDRVIGAGRVFLTMLADIAARAAWCQRHPRLTQERLPGFQHLPANVKTKKGIKPMMDLNYWGVLQFHWDLMRKMEAKKVNAPIVQESLALVNRMAAAAKRERGVTVREVLVIDNV